MSPWTSLIPMPFPGRSQAVPSSSIWLLAVCSYGGGRPGRSGHVRIHQVDRGWTHRGQCLTVIIPISLQPSDWLCKNGLQDSSLGNAFHVSTLSLTDITTHDQISQAFLLHICILQAIKYWKWEQPGNKATHEQLICYYPFSHPLAQMESLSERRKVLARNTLYSKFLSLCVAAA